MGRMKYFYAIAIPIFCIWLRKYLKGETFEGNERLSGKTAIVTGANTGIGLQIALGLATRNARVIMACRNLDNGNEAVKIIREKTTNGELVVKQLDLTSFKSIKSFAADINLNEVKIHALVNNAGIVGIPKSTTEDGFETVFQTNYLGPFFLTNLLLAKIKQTARSRIVNVSSFMLSRGSLNLTDLNYEHRKYDMFKAYANTKLANCLFSRALSKRLGGTDIGVYCLCPGHAATDAARYIVKEMPFYFLPFYYVFDYVSQFFVKNSWEGAQTPIYCAVSSKVMGHKGRFYSECREYKLEKGVLNDTIAEDLWTLSEKLTGLKK